MPPASATIERDPPVPHKGSMESVLKKTVASLETALRYNPDNVDLMTSLAEVYVRMGRFDQQTLDLCDKVLTKYPANAMLQMAQTVGYVIDQTNQLDQSLSKGHAMPAAEVIESSLSLLNEFLEIAPDCAEVWFAWTRLCVMAGMFEQAVKGIDRLKDLRYERIGELQRLLDWMSRKSAAETVPWVALYGAFEAIGDPRSGIRALERAYDKGVERKELGRLLLTHYLSNYNTSHPEQVPESVRPRFFQLLLDHGESSVTGEWLRKAALFGWQVTDHSKAYARSLIADEQFDTAFEILQRMSLDAEVKELLNQIAATYEGRNEIDEAVKILRYINNAELNDSPSTENQEIELTRSMELSLAELQVKNGRFGEALAKYIAALCLFKEPDAAILEKIDELLEQGIDCDPTALMNLALYFRGRNDIGRTIHYLNNLLDRAPTHTEGLRALQGLFDEALENNPESPELRFERGVLHRRMGRMDEAITDFKIASASADMSDRANRMLALTYRDAGHFREALNRYQNVRLNAEDLEVLYNLHLDFTRAEDFRSAISALEMIRRVDPGHRDAAERLAQLTDRSSRIAGGGYGGGNSGGGGSDSDAKMRELIGDMATGRYRYIDKIGGGGMGVVYKVHDIRQQKPVAMKILRDGLASSSKALDRFFREARIAAQVNHRNIVNIYDYNISSQDGQNYIVMEYIEGQSMREYIDLHFDDTISTSVEYVTEMLYYGVQIFDALHATHVKGIIHRDIKPDNVMITPKGDVKITDFGIVHVEEATFTPTGAMLGTPRYMAPEQVTGQRVDGRSDVYSVGILLYEVLTGSPPFMTGDIAWQQVNKTPVEPRSLNAAVPQSVNNFIMKCLEKRPENRYSSANEAKAVLAEIFQTLGGCKKFGGQTPWADSMQPLPSAAQSAAAQARTIDSAAPSPIELSPRKAAAAAGPDQLELDDLDLDLDFPKSR